MTSRFSQIPTFRGQPTDLSRYWPDSRGLFRNQRRAVVPPLVRRVAAALLVAFALGFGLAAWIFHQPHAPAQPSEIRT